MAAIKPTISGLAREVKGSPDMPLLWVWRDLVGVTGTAFGCGMAHCGACTVHVEGALRAIVALRRRVRWSVPLVWLLVAETAFDTVSNVMGGVRERLLGAASGVTWFILSFYVPVIIVSLGLLVWQLYTRRGEGLLDP